MARVLKELTSPATSTCTKIQLTPGERRAQGRLCGGWEERGNQGYDLFALNEDSLKFTENLCNPSGSCSHCKTKQNTSLSDINLADIEILGSVDKP